MVVGLVTPIVEVAGNDQWGVGADQRVEIANERGHLAPARAGEE